MGPIGSEDNFSSHHSALLGAILEPEMGTDQENLKFIGGWTITGIRYSRHDRVSGLAVEKEGEKKILRIVFEKKWGLFGHRIVGAHIELEDYW